MKSVQCFKIKLFLLFFLSLFSQLPTILEYLCVIFFNIANVKHIHVYNLENIKKNNRIHPFPRMSHSSEYFFFLVCRYHALNMRLYTVFLLNMA